jgi:hypothetical protein
MRRSLIRGRGGCFVGEGCQDFRRLQPDDAAVTPGRHGVAQLGVPQDRLSNRPANCRVNCVRVGEAFGKGRETFGYVEGLLRRG